MKPKWIIENFSRDASVNDLIDEVKRQGFECQHVGIVDYFDFNKSIAQPGDCVVFCGSIQLANMAREILKECSPVVWTNWENFNCSSYYPDFYQMGSLGALFNDSHEFIPFGLLEKKQFQLYKTFGKDATIFIRPDSGEKEFSGELVHLEELSKWLERQRKRGVKRDLLCVVSTPKKVNAECRFVVDGSGILAMSTYQFQGERCQVPSCPPNTIRFCEMLLADVTWTRPAPVFCIDICLDGDDTPWVMELTSFNSAGLYAAKKEPIVKRVSEIAEAEWLDRFSTKT